MSAALLDTNAISDLMRDQPKLQARLAAHSGQLSTRVIVRGKVLYGLERLPSGKKRTDLESKAQTILASLPAATGTEDVALVYGPLKASLQIQGLNLPDNDLWLAATALALGAILISRDHLFTQVPALHVEDWTA